MSVQKKNCMEKNIDQTGLRHRISTNEKYIKVYQKIKVRWLTMATMDTRRKTLDTFHIHDI